MAATQRRPLPLEQDQESAIKGVIVLLICAVYGIMLFIIAAICSRIYSGIKSSFSELLTHGQIVEVKKEEKYDNNHNVRSFKNLNIGSK